MEKQKSNNVILTERDKHHEKLMLNILKNLSDTPLILKGGTALYIGYGLNRFSEDLDFDSDKKLNLINKIKASAPHGIIIDNINVKKDTDTVSRYIVNYHVHDTSVKDALKMEISYRTPVSDEQITFKDGIRFSSVERIIDNKLHAAYDGNNIRIKGRDLFDLHFLASHYAEYFDYKLAVRLKGFTQDIDRLVSLYREDIQADPLLNKIMDVEKIALEINEMAETIYFTQQMQNNHSMQELIPTAQKQSKVFPDEATNKKEETTQNVVSSSRKMKF